MELITDLKPLLFFISPKHFDGKIIEEMDVLFRALWAAGEKYAMVSLPDPSGSSISASERKLIGEWASQKHVQDASKRLCVGSAVVSPSTLERGAMTAILWLWRPPFPLAYYPEREVAIDSALGHLSSARLTLPKAPPELRTAALTLLDTRFGRAS